MRRYTNVMLCVGLSLLSLSLAACGPQRAEITVEMTDFQFNPDTWSVPAGAEVTLTLNNDGSVEHEWVLIERDHNVTLPFDEEDESHILFEAEVDPGEQGTFTFTAPEEVGEYQVVCVIPGHLENGMEGVLLVE